MHLYMCVSFPFLFFLSCTEHLLLFSLFKELIQRDLNVCDIIWVSIRLTCIVSDDYTVLTWSYQPRYKVAIQIKELTLTKVKQQMLGSDAACSLYWDGRGSEGGEGHPVIGGLAVWLPCHSQWKCPSASVCECSINASLFTIHGAIKFGKECQTTVQSKR